MSFGGEQNVGLTPEEAEELAAALIRPLASPGPSSAGLRAERLDGLYGRLRAATVGNAPAHSAQRLQ